MEATEFKLEFKPLKQVNGGMTVIIVAAGSSTRMQGVNKQLIMLRGIPVIARTLTAFENSPYISRIILVARKEDIADMQKLCDKYMIEKVTDIIAGGNNRHESVMRGINSLGVGEGKVLIHDGARPLVDNDVIGGVVAALNNFDAALCAVKVNDTVKQVGDDGTVNATLDRSNLYLAQTPQGVDVAKFKDACLRVDADLLTDDVAVMEATGYTVKITEGSRKNIKITTAQDIVIAESFLTEET